MGWPGPMTHRQYKAWEAWQEAEWNHPSRSDWYLMQVAAEAFRAALSDEHRRKVEVKDFQLPFKIVRQEAVQKEHDPRPEYRPAWLKPMSRETAERAATAYAQASMKLKVEGTRRDAWRRHGHPEQRPKE